MFKDSMDVTNPAMVGHSFGGATTLMALGKKSALINQWNSKSISRNFLFFFNPAKSKYKPILRKILVTLENIPWYYSISFYEFFWPIFFHIAFALSPLGAEEKFKLGIVLDGWLFPLRDNEKLVEKVTQPVMFVNMDGFLNKDNLQKMQTFSTAKTERICYYIKGSVHQNIIDVPFIIRVSYIISINMQYLMLKRKPQRNLFHEKRFLTYSEISFTIGFSPTIYVCI